MRPQVREAVVFAGLAFVALLMAMAVGWVIMEKLPLLSANNAERPAYFVLFVILALAAAIVLFGCLRATAVLSGTQFGYTVELGGPAAIFVLVLLYGISQVPSPAPIPTDFALNFRFRPIDHSKGISEVFGEQNVKKARVVVFLPTQTLKQELNSDGYATISSIPGRYRFSALEINLASDTFLIKDRKDTYSISPGSELSLTFDVIPINFGPTKPPEQPEIPKTNRVVIINAKIAGVISGGTSDGHSPWCQRRSVQQCVVPERGGRLVPGTGSVTNEIRVGRAGWSVVKDTPEQICIEFWAATGACETEVSIRGQATAIEEYANP